MRPAAIAALLAVAACRAAPSEPTKTAAPLSSAARVIDRAQVLDLASEQRLATLSKLLEQRTGHQFVVVTVPTLGNQPIERYSLALFNRMGIGRKCCNDGVGLLVAPHERQARIEVGKGLAHTLTDRRAQTIMDDVMVPEFSRGQLQQGIERGANAVVTVIS